MNIVRNTTRALLLLRGTGSAPLRALATRAGDEPPPRFTLNTLGGTPRHARKRKGRGQGSGLGKTAGRGHKGQKARSGGSAGPYPGFEGGQTPLFKRVAKRGFRNTQHATRYAELSLGALQRAVDLGRLDASQPITQRALVRAGLVRRNKALPHGIKLLGGRAGAPTLAAPLTLELAAATRGAEEAVRAAGGTLHRVFHTRLGLRAHLLPHKFNTLPRPAAVPPRKRERGLLHPSELPSAQKRGADAASTAAAE